MTTVYLIGPDVFRPNAETHGGTLRALCAESDFPDLYPLDHALPVGIYGPTAQATWIYRANVDLIEHTNYALANLGPPRDNEPGNGTALEVSYALTPGESVYAYFDDVGAYAEYLARLMPEWLGEHPGKGRDGWQLGDLGLPLNLMLVMSPWLVAGSLREILRRLAEELGGNA